MPLEPTVHSWKMGRGRDDEILFRRSSQLGTSDIGPWVLDHRYRYPKAAFLVHLGQQHTTSLPLLKLWYLSHGFYEPSFCASCYIGHWVTFQGWLWWVKSYEHYPKSVLNPHSLPVPLCLNTCVQCEWFVCDKVAMYIALCSLVSCRFRHLSCGLCDTLWLQLWRFTEQPQKYHKNLGPMMNSYWMISSLVNHWILGLLILTLPTLPGSFPTLRRSDNSCRSAQRNAPSPWRAEKNWRGHGDHFGLPWLRDLALVHGSHMLLYFFKTGS